MIELERNIGSTADMLAIMTGREYQPRCSEDLPGNLTSITFTRKDLEDDIAR
jgi:hypothetical protein